MYGWPLIFGLTFTHWDLFYALWWLIPTFMVNFLVSFGHDSFFLSPSHIFLHF